MAGGVDAAVSGTETTMLLGIGAGRAEVAAGDTQIGEIGQFRFVRPRASGKRDHIVRSRRRGASRLVGGEAVVDELLHQAVQGLVLIWRYLEGGLEAISLHPEKASTLRGLIATAPGIYRVVAPIALPGRARAVAGIVQLVRQVVE